MLTPVLILGGSPAQGRHTIGTHRTPVPGEVRSDFTRSTSSDRVHVRARDTARPARRSRRVDSHSIDGEGEGADDTAVFFAADGMRQDLVERYAAKGLMPTMAEFLKKGTSATGNGLLTQAPPNTGAGWYTLATGAWPGVHGSTNNTFHINGQPFAQPHRRVRPGRAAGGVDRPVGRARRPQGRPGRVGRRPQRHDQGPDDRLPVVLLRPRRGDELHRQPGDALFDDAPFIAAFGLQFDHPAGYAGPGAVPGRRADAGHGLDRRCRRRTARPWRCGCACSTPAPTSTA